MTHTTYIYNKGLPIIVDEPPVFDLESYASDILLICTGVQSFYNSPYESRDTPYAEMVDGLLEYLCDCYIDLLNFDEGMIRPSPAIRTLLDKLYDELIQITKNEKVAVERSERRLKPAMDYFNDLRHDLQKVIVEKFCTVSYLNSLLVDKALGTIYPEVETTTDSGKFKSDGGSSAYYTLPEHASELRHLISYKGMSFARGNLFKACYRLGEKDGIDLEYDLNKIIFFANEMLDMHKRGEKV